MTDKFYLKEVFGEYKFYEEEDSFPLTEKQILNKLNENEQLKDENKEFQEENEQLKQRINSRLHFYRELYETTNNYIVKRVIEDLEDVLK